MADIRGGWIKLQLWAIQVTGWNHLGPTMRLVLAVIVIGLLGMSLERAQNFAHIHERESVGARAAEAGAAFFDAQRGCITAGLGDELAVCSEADARLPKEIDAAKAAATAIKVKNAFYGSCMKFNTADECEALIRRGWNIRRNEFIEKGQGR